MVIKKYFYSSAIFEPVAGNRCLLKWMQLMNAISLLRISSFVVTTNEFTFLLFHN